MATNQDLEKKVAKLEKTNKMNYSRGVQAGEKKGMAKGIWITLGVIVLLVLVGVGGYFAYKEITKNKDKDPENTQLVTNYDQSEIINFTPISYE